VIDIDLPHNGWRAAPLPEHTAEISIDVGPPFNGWRAS
jgi:uncharacterized protein YfaP (DUF2135 family)